MEALINLIDHIRDVRGAYQIAALAIVGAVVAAFVSPLVAGGALLLGLGAFAYGALIKPTEFQRPQSPPAVNPARGTLFAVADEHLAQQRPSGISEMDWILFRHLKTDQNIGLGRDGSIAARYFVDLREACLIPAQCDAMTAILCGHIRDQINVGHHHAVIIPKNGNAQLGLAVAQELGLAPVVVREWPFYGRWVETLVKSGRAIAVDDITTQGELLIEAVEHARDAGFTVNRAFVLIRRKEGNANEILERHRMALSAPLELSDDELDELVARVRQA